MTDESGRIRKETHFAFYGLIISFILISLIVCCFHQEIRKICKCLLPKDNKFQPKVHYKKDPDQIIIGEEALLPISNPDRSQERLHVPETKDGQANIPEIPKKAGKLATAPVSGGKESLSPVPSAPPMLYTQPGNTTLSASKAKKLNVVFDFPDKKSRKKN